MSSGGGAEALAALGGFIASQSSMGETLLRVTEITAQALSADMGGITMLGEDGEPTTAVFTDDGAHEIDAGQYAANRGPCLDAWREKRVVRLDDLDMASDRYPEFAKAAADHSVMSSLSLPLVAGERSLGALNIYARTANHFSADHEAVGTRLSVAAAVVLANASDYWQAAALSEQLSEAMRSRAVIEQAKGMLMAQDPALDAESAFEILRRASQRENTKVREIAQRLVNRVAQGSPA